MRPGFCLLNSGEYPTFAPHLKGDLMPGRREFEIAFVGLKPGLHEFTYEVGDQFFAEIGQQEPRNIKAEVNMNLDKHTSFLMLKFEIGGRVDLVCDRCGNPLTKDLWDEFEMLVKMVDDPDEMNAQDEDPDVFYIARTESHIDVANWIYEFVNLSIPTHAVCGDDEQGKSLCNPEVLDMLRKMNAEEEQKKSENPIWKGLDKFRNS
jgi:uncharacterized metal-binding protein YceD (DUF177 family)